MNPLYASLTPFLSASLCPIACHTYHRLTSDSVKPIHFAVSLAAESVKVKENTSSLTSDELNAICVMASLVSRQPKVKENILPLTSDGTKAIRFLVSLVSETPKAKETGSSPPAGNPIY